MTKDAIAARIREFLARGEPGLAWLRELAARHGFLPLYVGWQVVLGIRPDGSVVRCDHEAAPDAVTPLPEGRWRRIALYLGSQEYPELRPLVPERPAHAVDCQTCGGSGAVPQPCGIVCGCGGLGWVLPDEQGAPRLA